MKTPKNALNKSMYEGKIFKSKSYGDFTVLEYINARKVVIEFNDTGYKNTVKLSNVLEGAVKDRLSPTVFGVGIVGYEEVCFSGKMSKEYTVWKRMLERCYCDKLKNRCKTYKTCSSSESFKVFPLFKKWCLSQKGYSTLDEKGNLFALDKDILIKGNKVYSEETCCFVPQEVNNLFIKRKFVRWNRPIDSFEHKEKAFRDYKLDKEVLIKELANKWKGQIDNKVYLALINYEVEIDD